ncbi:P-loop NTPase fold protein [Bradyrhizobium manausense]
MTATAAVKGEIERFLKSSEPDVLCISGEWGVGKTYTWQTILDRLRTRREIGLSRYSYVSLFGIASLDAFKVSIFENLEFLVPQGNSGFDALLSGGNSILKQGKQWIGVAGALPVVGGAIAKAQPLLFTAIRNQIICIDDLERRGAISVKDVFGLISYLREQRACKVVLLLNETQLKQDDGAAKEFDGYFEKVIDTKMVFAPNAAEAVAIAIADKDSLSTLISEHCIKLRIANIRVIKKIERLIRMVAPHLEVHGPGLMRQAVHSLTMFGWCKFDTGAAPPPMNYVKQSSLGRYMTRRDEKVSPSPDELRWDTILGEYEWGNLDDLDVALLHFVESSVLNVEEIETAATETQAKRDRTSKAGSFEQSWRLFHDSFVDNEDSVCDALISGFKINVGVLSRRNLDEVVSVLRALERDKEADDLIDFTAMQAGDSFWVHDDPFDRAVNEPRIVDIAKQRAIAAAPVFDFESDLVLAAQNLDHKKHAQLAAAPVEQYQALFEACEGEQLRRVVLSALDYRRIMNATADMTTIVRNAETALRAIAKTSRLNALRVQKYVGEDVKDDGNEGGQ